MDILEDAKKLAQIRKVIKDKEQHLKEASIEFKEISNRMMVLLQNMGVMPIDISDEQLKPYTDFFNAVELYYLNAPDGDVAPIVEKFKLLPELAQTYLQDYVDLTIKAPKKNNALVLHQSKSLN